jgi:hypothetical protein
MSYYSFKDWYFEGFKPSKKKYKKYDATIINKKTGKIKILSFGDKRYQHYMDTALQTYKNLDHNDKERQKRYIARHKVFIKNGYFSPSYFSMMFLWS